MQNSMHTLGVRNTESTMTPSPKHTDAPICKKRSRQELSDLLLAGAQSPMTEPVDSAYFEGLRERIRRTTVVLRAK